jgi:hypothetical protein
MPRQNALRKIKGHDSQLFEHYPRTTLVFFSYPCLEVLYHGVNCKLLITFELIAVQQSQRSCICQERREIPAPPMEPLAMLT